MAILRKDNRAVRLNGDDLVYQYLADGYDLIDEEGKVLKRATGGKMIPLGEHNKVLDKVEELKEEIKVLESENLRLDGLVKKHNNQQKDFNKR